MPLRGRSRTGSVAFFLHRDGHLRGLGDRAARPGNRDHMSPGGSSGVRDSVRRNTAAPRGPHESGAQQNSVQTSSAVSTGGTAPEKDQHRHCPSAETKYLRQGVVHRRS